VPRADFGERIVRKPGEFGREIGSGNQFERRIGERQNVLQIAEFIEQSKPRFDVAQGREARKRSHCGVARYQGCKTLQVRLRHEVIEDIDFHVS